MTDNDFGRDEAKGPPGPAAAPARRTVAELVLEVAALREELAGLQHLTRTLADYSKRAQIEQAIAALRDRFEARLLEYAEALERTNDELVLSNRLLKIIADAIPDPIFIKDRDSRFLMGNAALANLIGVSAEDLIGCTGREHFPQETMDKVFADDRAIMAVGEPRRYEETVLITPANARTYLTTKIPFRDKSGAVAGIVGVSRDITGATDNLKSIHGENK